MSQARLAAYKASDIMQWRFLVSLLKPAHFKRWINRGHITPLEFGFISSGFEPILDVFLFKIVEDLQTILHHISRQISFEDIHSSDKTFIPFIKELFPHIKKEEDAKDKILSQAQCLLDCLEIINRGMMAMPKEYQACFATEQVSEQGASKEKLWRFDFLVHWAKTDLHLSLPTEICMLDNDVSIQKELDVHFGKTIHKLNESELIIDGWFNLNNCRAPKLKALIESYVKEERLCKKNIKRKFSTGNIQEHLKDDFDVIGSEGDSDDFLKKLSHVATINTKGASLKKKDPR